MQLPPNPQTLNGRLGRGQVVGRSRRWGNLGALAAIWRIADCGIAKQPIVGNLHSCPKADAQHS
jgi:hypothetical protein